MNNELKFYKSPLKSILLMLLCSIFVILGIYLLTTNSPKIVGWLNIIFFGLGYPVGLYNILDRRPVIIINTKGIWDRSTRQEMIPWYAIEATYPMNISGQRFVALHLNTKFKLKKVQAKWAAKLNKSIGAQEVNIHLGSIKKIDPTKLSFWIMKMVQSDEETKSTLVKKAATEGF